MSRRDACESCYVKPCTREGQAKRFCLLRILILELWENTKKAPGINRGQSGRMSGAEPRKERFLQDL